MSVRIACFVLLLRFICAGCTNIRFIIKGRRFVSFYIKIIFVGCSLKEKRCCVVQAVLSKVCGETYPKTEPILWLNMRQEPSLYINGEPVCARPPNKVRGDLFSFQIYYYYCDQIGEYAELGDVRAEDLDKDEAEFLRVCETRVKDGEGKLKVTTEEHEMM